MNKIIVMFDDEDRELNMSLYDFIDEQYRKSNPIMVCHVTEEEYNNMENQIKFGCLNERLPRVTAENMGYYKFRYVVAYNTIENYLLVSDYDNPDKIGSYLIDTDGIHYDEKGYQITNHPTARGFVFSNLKVYTTESYRDIIAHYEARQTKNVLIKEDTLELEQTREELIEETTKKLAELIGHHCKTCNTLCCGGLGDNNNCDRWSHTITLK